jgi:hypothetical protein
MSDIPNPVAYDSSICLHDDAIAPEACDLFGQGASVRPLRRLDDGALRSGLIAFPAGWEGRGPLRAGAVVQMFLRAGTLSLSDEELGAGAFITVPRGAVLPKLASATGGEAIVILDDARTLEPGETGGAAIVLPDVFTIEPIVPVILGKRLEGFERRVLWEDPETGSDTRLLRIPAGFEGSGGPSFHPVEEEIFCLEGDIAPDDNTPMHAGSYLWNPKLSVHGFHEHSRGGCVLLEWHDGPWAFHKYEGEANQSAFRSPSSAIAGD